MHFVRGLFVLLMCVQFSCLQASSALGGSLWGKQLEFKSQPCLWELHPETVVPALGELSVCLLLKNSFEGEWTAFVYKAPGSSDIELGLQGKKDFLSLWLFGNETKVENRLTLNEWHSVCITWSGKQQKLDLFVNGTTVSSRFVEAQSRTHLASHGTLTLGRSHFVVKNLVQPEFGKSLIGDISQFRIWSKQWEEGELKSQECTEGDVIGCDLRHWKTDCAPPKDSSLFCECSRFKVKMKINVQYKHSRDDNCPLTSVKKATELWLADIFPSNVSVNDIIISPSLVQNHTVLQQVQESHTPTSPCPTCFLLEVFVKLEPAADVGVAQSDITERLSSSFSLDLLNVTADPDSILVYSVDSFPAVTVMPPTVSTVVSEDTSIRFTEVTPTQSETAYPSSSTEELLDINKTFDRADIFFRVNMSLNIIGILPDPLISIEALVDKKLNYSSTMKMLNFVIFKTGSDVLNSEPSAALKQQEQYYCTFHVQEDFMHDAIVVQRYIGFVLNMSEPVSNGSVSIHTTALETRHIVPPDCPEDFQKSLYGNYFWPRTFPQEVQTMRCEDPPHENAFRFCILELHMDMTRWSRPDMKNCLPRVTLPEIENVTVTTDNKVEVVEALQDLVTEQLSDSSELSLRDLDTVVGKLQEVVDVGTDFQLGADIVTIVADLLVSNTNMTGVSNVVLDLTSKMGDTMDFQGTSESITAPALALSLCNVETEGFTGLTFGVSSVSANLEPEVFLDQTFVNDQNQNIKASISLPPEVQGFFPHNTTRLQFQFYATDELFQDPYLSNSTTVNRTLNSYIVSASLNNSIVHNLKDKVVVNLSHQKAKQPDDVVHCAFWDFQKNGGLGGWNGKGCETQDVSPFQTRCLCDHLTHFAVLLDVSRTPISERDSYILTLISYIGCGISAIFLGITFITYVAFGKLRRDNPSKILINLSAALLGLCMLFLLDAWLSSFSIYGLCIFTAAALHYFLLASFTWMGLEALHMYLALVKVFNIYVPSYILKFCAVGWGLPLVIVSLVLAIDKDSYGSASSVEAAVVLQSTDQFCWVTRDEVFYVTVMGFILLTLLANLSVFVVVLIQIKRMRVKKTSSNTKSIANDLRAVASLTVLLGLTWSLGFLSFGPGRVVIMYLFCILNTMQGFFVFLFHCLMKDNVRKQWRTHLCCGRFRLNQYTEWSNTVSGGNQGKKKHLVNMDSDYSATTTTRKISNFSD